MNLYPYQVDIVEKARALMRNGCKRMILQSPTGSGKTIMATFIAKRLYERGKSFLFTVPRIELLKQTCAAFSEAGVPYSIIAAGHKESLSYGHIATIQTLARRGPRDMNPQAIVVDECFVAGTLVDGVPIENIRIGDCVTAHSGAARRVLRVFKQTPQTLCTVFAGGRRVSCTANHKFFTPNGWVEARDLTKYSMVLSSRHENMQGLPIAISGKNAVQGREDLLTGLRKGIASHGSVGDYGQNESKICFPSHDCAKSDETRRCSSEGVVGAEENRTQAAMARRERDGANVVRIGAIKKNRPGDGQGSWNSWTSETVGATALQIRPSPDGAEVGSGSGREVPLRVEPADARQEEGSNFAWTRVDGVTFHKRTSDGTFGRMCPDGFVYNLEVEIEHSYFANGLGVSNCHHTPAKSWAKVMGWFPGAYIVGLTATPCRLDGIGLKQHFDEIIKGPSVKSLIADGYLSDFRYFCPGDVSMKGVRKRMGDWSASGIESRVDKKEITGSAVEHYLLHGRGCRGLVYAASVRHAEHVAGQFNEAGVPSAVLSGDTPADVRADIMQKYREGAVLVLVNCELFTEGLDVPGIVVLSMLRPTCSTSLFLQMVGRSLRVCPGKDRAIIMDHVGNWKRHGFPDDDREWSLDGLSKPEKTGEADIRIRTCEECFAATRMPADKCSYCGAPFKKMNKAEKIKESSGTLVEVDRAAFSAARLAERKSARSLDELIALGKARKYKYPEYWARHVYNSRMRHARAN